MTLVVLAVIVVLAVEVTFNLMNTQRTVKVSKVTLLARIKQNLTDHVAAFEAASKTWAADVGLAASRLNAAPLNEGAMAKLQHVYHSKPRSFQESYENAIEQLNFEVRDELELSLQEFNQLACDKWDWANQFMSNSYSSEALNFVKASR